MSDHCSRYGGQARFRGQDGTRVEGPVRTTALIHLCSSVFICGFLAAFAAAQPAGDRTIVAQVNDQPIYKADVDRALQSLTRGQQVGPDQLAQFQAASLAQVISQRLVFDFIKEKELIATPQEIDKQIDQIREQLEAQDRSLTQYMRETGMTRAGLRNRIGNEVSVQKLLNAYGSEEMVQAYFKKNARQFDGTELRVSHILLRPKGSGNLSEMNAVRDEAIQIKAHIAADKITFADAAKQHSAGPSRTEGGDLGFIRREGPMIDDFNRAAFDLEKGQVSDPVTTTFGMHLITVTEVKPGGKTLEEVRGKLMPAFHQWLVDQLIEQQIKTTKIEFNDSFPHYKPGTRELAAKEE